MAIESKMSRGPIGARPIQERKKSVLIWGIWAFFIVLATGAIWYFLLGPGAASQESEASITSGEYQAIFLDNGQVYFGKIELSRSDFVTLTDVFYLQSGTAVEQTTNLALTKLGSEAHGPEDKIQINKEHILFIEVMKEDSKIVQAIQQYKSSKE